MAHVCAMLRRHIIGAKITKAILNNDRLLFPALKEVEKPENFLQDFEKKLNRSQITSIGRHGKYFWLRLHLESNSPGVLLMHFGMTGMIRIKQLVSHLVVMENGGDKAVLKEIKSETPEDNPSLGSEEVKKEEEQGDEKLKSPEEILLEEDCANVEWPPKYTKFELELNRDGRVYNFAFTDPRRLGRIRFLEGPTVETDAKLLDQKPLAQLGPDYSKPRTIDKQTDDFVYGDPDPDNHGRPRLDFKDFLKLVMSKKKAIKSLLLEQEFFAGVGNWVADEILFHAKIYPGEVLNSVLVDEDDRETILKRLYDSLIYVTEYTVKVEANVRKFPKNWLMLYRWGKRRKNQPNALTNDGYEVSHVTVGGRTSSFVPEIQVPLRKASKASKVKSEKEDEKRSVKRKKTK